MTRREFDRLTRVNFGCRMASDERAAYRRERCFVESWQQAHGARTDTITLRAAEMAWLRAEGELLPALGIASKWRAVAEFRRRSSRPLLMA